ncbi:uncharacterized protein LOC128740390 [Sabethes cyaneus]|uniref:uncharacterized protein LOC128740390 n=1 Tax=Sabethes cyaneus TaxID=53552 RepID=UPI00237EC74B|nr:uncharacterized protein LOC128740390 [Sabethes cyaneus]
MKCLIATTVVLNLLLCLFITPGITEEESTDQVSIIAEQEEQTVPAQDEAMSAGSEPTTLGDIDSEDVNTESTVGISGVNIIIAPKVCPKGQKLDHRGVCRKISNF